MKNSPLVSVCIPVFNGKKYISETISSIVAQGYPNVEILVQDNASTDGTWELLESIAKENPNLKLERNEKNVGMAPNWNLAINRAKGDYVMLLSADDLLEPGFICECLKIFDLKKVDIVTTNHYYLESGIKRKRKLKIKEGLYQNFSGKVLLLNPFSINFTLFSKHALKRFLNKGEIFTKNILTCDYDLWIKIALSGLSVFYVKDCLASYRIHEANLSKHIVRMNRQAAVVILLHRRVLQRECLISYKITIFRFILRMLRNYLKTYELDKRLIKVLDRELFRGA